MKENEIIFSGVLVNFFGIKWWGKGYAMLGLMLQSVIKR